MPAFSCGRISPRPEAQGAASFGIFRVWVRSRLLGIVGIEHDRRKGFPVDEEWSSFRPLVVALVAVVALFRVLLLEVIRIGERGGLSAPTVREDRASEKLNGHEHAEDFIRRWRRRVCRVRSSSTLHRNLVWGGGSLLVSGYKEKTIIVMARGGGDTHESDPGESFAQVVIPSEEVEHGQVHAPKVVFGQSFEQREIVRERRQSVQSRRDDRSFPRRRRRRRGDKEGIDVGGRRGFERFLASDERPTSIGIESSEEIRHDDVKRHERRASLERRQGSASSKLGEDFERRLIRRVKAVFDFGFGTGEYRSILRRGFASLIFRRPNQSTSHFAARE